MAGFHGVHAVEEVNHGYATVDLDIVWTTVVEDLPELRTHLIELKEALEQ